MFPGIISGGGGLNTTYERTTFISSSGIHLRFDFIFFVIHRVNFYDDS